MLSFLGLYFVDQLCTFRCEEWEGDFLPRGKSARERGRVTGEEACGKNFTTNANLQKHRQLQHLDTGSYPCLVDGCGAKLNSSSALTKHKEIKHGSRK